MRTAPALVVAALSLLALAGCVPDDDPVIPGPLPSSTPIFASDEEALAAAEEAYGAYLAVSDQIIADGGQRPDRLLEVATQEVLDVEIEGYEQLVELGWHGVGASTLDHLTLQSFDAFAVGGKAAVTVYACVDVSGVDIQDSAGVSVVSADRPSRTPFQTTFDTSGDGPPGLVLAAKEPWSGDDFCD